MTSLKIGRDLLAVYFCLGQILKSVFLLCLQLSSNYSTLPWGCAGQKLEGRGGLPINVLGQNYCIRLVRMSWMSCTTCWCYQGFAPTLLVCGIVSNASIKHSEMNLHGVTLIISCKRACPRFPPWRGTNCSGLWCLFCSLLLCRGGN